MSEQPTPPPSMLKDKQLSLHRLPRILSEDHLNFNFEEVNTIEGFEDNLEGSTFKRKCTDCLEKEKVIEETKTMLEKYEKMKRDYEQHISQLMEQLQKQQEQIKTSEEQSRSANISMRNSMVSSSNIFLPSRRSINSQKTESNIAHELLQKNVAKEEEIRKLKNSNSHLKQEMEKKEKVYLQRVDLLYTLIQNYQAN